MDELTVFKLTENEIRNFYVKLALGEFLSLIFN